MDGAPPHCSPAITGHDLMLMFPAPSPMTAQMKQDTSCRLFERQERAFFAAPGGGIVGMHGTTQSPGNHNDETNHHVSPVNPQELVAMIGKRFAVKPLLSGLISQRR